MTSWAFKAISPASILAVLMTQGESFGNSSSNTPRVDGREKITRSEFELGAFDYTSRFPSERDQGSQGQCFAFAAVGLLDEHACASAKAECGGAPCQ